MKLKEFGSSSTGCVPKALNVLLGHAEKDMWAGLGFTGLGTGRSGGGVLNVALAYCDSIEDLVDDCWDSSITCDVYKDELYIMADEYLGCDLSRR